MPITMNGEIKLNASRQRVWEEINNPEALKASIPGCETLEKWGDTSYRATVKLKVGPVATTFKGSVELCEIDPANSCRIVGQGEGGLAGFAKGGARVSLHDLADSDDVCVLRYEVSAEVGGKIAQLGSRLINSVARNTADQFFKNFAAVVEPAQD